MLATDLKHLNTSVGRMCLPAIGVRTPCVLDMEIEVQRGQATSPMGMTEHRKGRGHGLSPPAAAQLPKLRAQVRPRSQGRRLSFLLPGLAVPG